jgi:hypothetical protein
VIYNESVYGLVLPSYFSHPSASAGPLPALPGDGGKVLVALAGVMVSPSRGLLIYSPIFLFSIWGMIWALRTRWRAPLSAYLMAVIIANWFLLGVYFQNWLGGHSYGPRLFSDLTPFFIFFLIPALLKVRATRWSPVWAIGLLVLFGASAFIHSRGARNYDVWGWNSTPANDMARVWDWRDAQFLRGLRFAKFQK